MQHAIKRRKANWISHILRRNCLLNRVIEGNIEGTRRRRRRFKQPLDDLTEMRRSWKLQDEVLDRLPSMTHFWKKQCTNRATEYVMMMMLIVPRYK